MLLEETVFLNRSEGLFLLWDIYSVYNLMRLIGIPRRDMHHLSSLHRLWVAPDKQPHFTCYSKQITILEKPIDFYIQLHKGVRQANRRIVLSSLYLGTGNLEKYLVQQIDNKIKRSRNIRVTTLMDYNRSMRTDRSGKSGADLLKALKTDNAQSARVKIAFFKQPYGMTLSRQVRQLSGESAWYMIQEVMGVHHMKYYVFDDQVILSGANLSASYFTDRMDRWVVLDNVPALADYLEDATNCIANNGVQVDLEDQWVMAMDQPVAGKFNAFKKIFKHHFKMLLFSKRVHLNQDYSVHFGLKEEKTQEKEEKEKESIVMSEKETAEMARYFQESKEVASMMAERKEQAREILEESFDKGDVANIVRRIEESLYKPEEEAGGLVNMGEKVYLFPVFQIPCIGYQRDQEVFTALLSTLCQDTQVSKLLMASGYMNYDSRIQQVIKSTDKPIELLTAAPMANSFYQAGRVKGWVPYLYRQIQWGLQSSVGSNVTVYEWQDKDNTFHSKGLWAVDQTGESVPLTILGSTNFSHRSYFRDTECTFYMVSLCPDLNQRLYQESQRQFDKGVPITKEECRYKDDVKLGMMSWLLTKLFKNYL